MSVTIALDCMGGDHGIKATVPAALSFLERHADCRMVLVGRQADLEKALAQARSPAVAALRIQDASEVVEMGDAPAIALRSKRDSSMRVAVDLVRAGEADACVSAGNTGALMAISRFVLKMMPGVERPAIASMLPTMRAPVCMLDLGANVNCTAVNLLQFAVMGSSLFTAVYGNPNPTVGLLNVGEEEIKGNEIAKQAGDLLKSSGLNYQGNVEGDDVYKGTTDVVVCDGFVGNVFLKGSEGLARMLAAYLRQEYERTLWNRLAAFLSLPAIGAFRKRVDPRRYNGASLLGLRGIVVKSHGSADGLALEIAMERAYHEARNKVLDNIAAHMPQMLEKAG